MSQGQQKQAKNKFGRYQAHHNAPKAKPQFASVTTTQPTIVRKGNQYYQSVRPGVWKRIDSLMFDVPAVAAFYKGQ